MSLNQFLFSLFRCQPESQINMWPRNFFGGGNEACLGGYTKRVTEKGTFSSKVNALELDRLTSINKAQGAAQQLLLKPLLE